LARYAALYTHYKTMIGYAARRASTRDGIAKVLRHPGTVRIFLRNWIKDANYRAKSAADLMYEHAAMVRSFDALSKIGGRDFRILQIPDAFPNPSRSDDTRELARLFNLHGSDKAGKHNYYLIYAALLNARRNDPISILEIGLGTNNLNVRSNMGVNGRPGASLRAFRDWAPKAAVYGADIDRRVLFEEDRIRTFYVDQTEDFNELADALGEERFDLIIDDGLHEPHANLNTLEFALGRMKDDGIVVVEDIEAQYIGTWRILSSIISARYEVLFVQTREAYVCCIRRRAASA
jgi:hypothetical protein